MKAYEWMVTYTPQREWIERKGILDWLAIFFGGVGSGLYLVSLWFNNFSGMLIGWLIVVVLKGSVHMADLGQPLRFWRGILRPHKSWISRGLVAMALFAAFGALQLVFSYWLPGSYGELIFKILAGVLAVAVATYVGFMLAYVIGIPFWNNGLLPILFLISGITRGFALLLAIALVSGGIPLGSIQSGTRIMLLITAILLATYLLSGSYMMAAGRFSVVELLKGKTATLFWVGVVVCGILIPGGISTFSFLATGVSHSILFFGIVCEMIGELSLRYCFLKVGFYSPLIPIHS